MLSRLVWMGEACCWREAIWFLIIPYACALLLEKEGGVGSNHKSLSAAATLLLFPLAPSPGRCPLHRQVKAVCVRTAHMHPASRKGVIRQSLARDLRFVTGIICIYWRRAGPSLLWEKPSTPPRVPQLVEGLIDLLITIVLLFFNCSQGMASLECGVCFC